jgi:hyperosmotically inducible periplasmic protein
MLTRVLTTLPGVALCVALAGPAFAQDKPKEKPGDTKIVIKDDTTPKVKKAGRVVSDASINTAVKTRLMKDKVARGTSIDVSTSHGVVTIAGSVPTAADRARIGRLVEHTSGVKRVENDLTVK